MALRSLARCYPKQTLPVLVLLGTAFTAYLFGIFRPFTAVTKLWIFESEVSVWSSLVTLADSKEWFLFWVILLFTVVFPFLKMSALAVLWLRSGLRKERRNTLFRCTGQLGKWSMLDVFIVAVLVVYIKAGTLADITIRDGIVIFTVSVVLTQAAALWIGRVAERHVEE